MATRNPGVVAAIDFGTSNTKLAFGLETDEDSDSAYKVVTFTEWECAPGGDVVHVAPTSILLDETGEVAAYGWEAENKYGSLEDIDRDTYRLFKHFKMELHQEKNFSMEYRISPINGSKATSMPAIQVFSKALKYLKDKLMDFIESKMEGLGITDSDDIRWVLTVPAIWKPGARHFMREAAYRGGLCNRSTREHLVIALEPECAALYVRTQKDKSSRALKSLNYAVVDCGGGTVDIAYHSLESLDNTNSFIVRELAPPNGGPYGGTLVDKAFEHLLEKIFGKPKGFKLVSLMKSKQGHATPFIDQLKKEHTVAWMDLMKEFETCKTMLKGQGSSEPIRLRLDQNFGDACFEISKASASNLIKECGVEGVSLSPSKMLMIEAHILESFFQEPIQEIVKCLDADLARNRSISALYMVGSFSSSALVFHSVQNKLNKKVRSENIVRPPESGLAIVKGAVFYGFHPTIIQERISALSYGLKILQVFDASQHPEKKKFYERSTGITYCDDVYQEFLPCGGKVVNTTTLIKRIFSPASPDQTDMGIKVYCAPQKVRYTDDRGCNLLATIKVPMPNTKGGTNRRVQVEIEFDGPEIHIVCTDETSSERIDKSIEFHYGK